MAATSAFSTCIGVLLAWTAGYASVSPAASQPAGKPENPMVWQPRTKSVAVFKNGLGFFMREGKTSLHRGWCTGGEVPPAALGALAFYALGEGQIVDVVGSGPGETIDFDDHDASSKAGDKRERLRASLNTRVCLVYTHAEKTAEATGKLISINEEFAIVEGSPHRLAVPIEQITRLQVLDLPLRVHVAGAPETADTSVALGMAYLRQGITWIPEYTVKIIDDQTAELTLRGTVVNEAEDLIHCDVHFVVGVPHFVHSDRLAPLAIGQVIRTIGASMVPAQVMSQFANNAFVTPLNTPAGAATIERPVPSENPNLNAVFASLPSMEGPAGADYTVYTRKDLTIRRGEKAVVTLFTQRIRYAHLYRWTPPARMQHLLALHNDTDTAWTTGPYLALSDGRPLSEDLLRYTPKNGVSEIPVTTAINVLCERKESETDRRLKAHEPSKGFFVDLVELRGELTIRNLDKTEVTVAIENPVTGKPTTASDNGELTIDTAKLQLLERSGSIRWNVRVAPGETKKLTYTLERYVPSK